MKRTNIYLDEAQAASLDKLAEQQGVSRAEVIRNLLDRALNNADDDLESDLKAIGDSFGVLRDADSPERSPGDRERHLDWMWRRTS
ncbi:CopG family transcriptional regulator [Mycobacterium sp. 236(2023)]|uniref:ribbon-helix-helix domain-containing protein n=1 Tax=Mycobacterium sp. 236(2023) TaxID=3038163 RepID=UPI002414EE5B|nr:CopG family transcriptional regulator [Mycobacterium sp. 236(2023)]MDG4664141.1 ribbon-helix-helix domain-containing protein [Mycobacterium sp. 236(2023)]